MSAYRESQSVVLRECLRILKPGGWLCWQVGNHVDDGEVMSLDFLFAPLLAEIGYKLRRRVVWTFGSGLHCKNRFSGRHEVILCATKGEGRPPNQAPDIDTDIWDIVNVKNNHPEKTMHPCSFPVELAERLILAYSDPGDRVFDPFMGVGSTLVAAEFHQRIGSGCDVVPEYVAEASRRLAALQEGTLRIRPLGRPIARPPSGRVRQAASMELDV